MEKTYLTERTDLPKRGLFNSINSVSYSGEYFTFRSGSGHSILIPVLGGRTVAIEDLLDEQVGLLAKILREARKSAINLTEGFGVVLDNSSEDGDEES